MPETPTHPIRWWHGWGPAFALPTAAVVFTPEDWHAWVRMWLIAGAIFAGVKWLTWRRTPGLITIWKRHAGYLLGWPGLDAAAFLDPELLLGARRPDLREWLAALAKTLCGAGLFWGVSRVVPADQPFLAGCVGTVGLLLLLHSGFFHLLSCAWRAAGVNARPLMNRPFSAESVSEFWGRRWNTAFRDLTHRFLFRPLTARLGVSGAVLAGFFVSGLLHDLVISIPAGAGYGGPTLYFLIQALALLIERSSLGRSLGLGRGWRGWVFATTVVLVPAPMLFHPPFMREVIVPFMDAVGAY